MDLDNFQVRLQYGIASLCNQLLPEFSSYQFETLHRCYKHIEDGNLSSSVHESQEVSGSQVYMWDTQLSSATSDTEPSSVVLGSQQVSLSQVNGHDQTVYDNALNFE